MLTLVGGQAAPDVVGFLEAALLVAAHVALVRSGIDEFAGHVSLLHRQESLAAEGVP